MKCPRRRSLPDRPGSAGVSARVAAELRAGPTAPLCAGWQGRLPEHRPTGRRARLGWETSAILGDCLILSTRGPGYVGRLPKLRGGRIPATRLAWLRYCKLAA